MEVALKQPNGVLAIAVFLNESHDDNPAIAPFIDLLKNVTYKGNETKVRSTGDKRQQKTDPQLQLYRVVPTGGEDQGVLDLRRLGDC